MTHSQGGGQGWSTVLKTDNVKGIVAYEPGSGFLFPEGEVPADLPSPDGWRVRLEMARKWRDTVNRHGGHVTLVHLPEIGIRGNTHFQFSDLNNVEIADLMSKFLHENGLDR